MRKKADVHALPLSSTANAEEGDGYRLWSRAAGSPCQLRLPGLCNPGNLRQLSEALVSHVSVVYTLYLAPRLAVRIPRDNSHATCFAQCLAHIKVQGDLLPLRAVAYREGSWS